MFLAVKRDDISSSALLLLLLFFYQVSVFRAFTLKWFSNIRGRKIIEIEAKKKCNE